MKALFVIFLILIHFTETFAQEKKVKVESSVDYVENEEGELEYKRKNYLALRPNWGTRLTISSAEQKPVPPLLEQDRTPIQLEFSILKNFKLISTGFEVGYLDTKWSFNNKIKVFSFGLVAHLDGIFKTPYIVPMVGAGVANFDAKTATGLEIETEGDFIPYFKAGFLFSLNWIDKNSAMLAYDEFGLLNTYIYLGVRKWSETNSDPGLNIEIDLSPEFGIQLEF